jgi:hypothetical protein
MRPFWPIVCGALFVTLCVWPYVVMGMAGRDVSHHAYLAMRQLLCYPATVALLSVVWAIVCRHRLERGRLSLADIFALITILAVGLCFARSMLSRE